MARRRGACDGTGARYPRRVAVAAGLCLLAAPFLTGCSGDEPEEPPPPAAPMALNVESGRGAGSLGDRERTAMETEVGDVLSNYVVNGFLGDYPRQDFVRAFDDFTVGAAQDAAEHLDLLTGARFADASAVRATRLDATLSVLVLERDVVGATAAVRFGFEAEVDGETRPFTLRGRFLLKTDDGTWTVFGYDVARDDGGVVEFEESP